MGTHRSAALAAACLLLSAGLASASGIFSDLRRAEPAVGEMIAAAPSAALNGRLNRVSSVLDSASVRDLPGGSSALVPAEFHRDMERALGALAEEVAEALTTLDGREALVLLYAVDQVAYRRTVDLLSDADWTYCGPDAADCPSPDALAALDRLGYVLADAFYRVAEFYEIERNAPGAALPAFEILMPEGYNSQTMSIEVDRAITQTSRALGIESIDD